MSKKKWYRALAFLSVLSLSSLASAQYWFPDFSGTFRKEDGFTLRLSQNGSQIFGQQVGGAGGWSHVVHGQVNGNVAYATVERVDPSGCLSHLYVTFVANGPGAFEQYTTGTDGRCGLAPTFTEHFQYVRTGR